MKDLNDEGEKMGEGKWNESDLWQREAEENGLQTEPELQNAVQNPKQIRKTCRREVRRVCNALGWALAFFSVMTVLVSILLEVAASFSPARRLIVSTTASVSPSTSVRSAFGA